MGLARRFKVWIASNDRSRAFGGGRFDEGCLTSLPSQVTGGASADAIGLIDVLWPEADGHIRAAFEVERTTSIYSGIVRMLDLARPEILASPEARTWWRRTLVKKRLGRSFADPSSAGFSDLHIRYFSYGELHRNREAIVRFRHGLHPIEQLSGDLT